MCTEVIYAKKGRSDGVAKVTKRDGDDVLAEIKTKKLQETHNINIIQ